MKRTSSSSPAFRSCRIVPGLDDEHAAALELVALGRLAEIDRERPVEHDEDLLLRLVGVALPARARRIAPDVRARLRHRVRETGGGPSAAVVARHPVEFGRVEDRESHDGVSRRRTIGPPCPLRRRAGRRARRPSTISSAVSPTAPCARARGRGGHGEDHALAAAVEHAEDAGVLVLRAQPVESETTLSYAGIGDLFDPVLDASLEPLPPVQRRALSRALVLDEEDDAPLDPRALGVAVMNALRTLAEEQTCARRHRRLAVARLRLLGGCSRTEPGGFARSASACCCRAAPASRACCSTSCCALRPASGSREWRRCPGRPGARPRRPRAARRVAPTATARRGPQASGGNPFYALEIVRALQRTGASIEAGQPLPLPESLHDLVARPAACTALREPRLPPRGGGTRASHGRDHRGGQRSRPRTPASRPRSRRTSSSSTGTGSASPIRCSPQVRLRIAATPLRRHEIHARLAELLEDPEARAWQLAACDDEPDEGVAAVLEDAARHARARGAPRPGALLLDRAASSRPRTPSQTSRDEGPSKRLTFTSSRGRLPTGRSSLQEPSLQKPQGAERARALVRSPASARTTTPARRARSLPSGDRRGGEWIAGHALRTRRSSRHALPSARAVGRGCAPRSRCRAAPSSATPQLAAEALATQAGCGGRAWPAEAAETAEERFFCSAAARTVRSAPAGRRGFGGSFLDDELISAHDAYLAMVMAAGELGDESSLPYIYVMLGQIDCALGGSRTRSHGRKDTPIAEQSGQRALVGYTLSRSRRLVAGASRPDRRGDLLRLRALSTRAGDERRARLDLRDVGARPSEPSPRAIPRAHTLRDSSALVEHHRREAIAEPGALPFLPDAVEALVELGSPGRSRGVAGWYEAQRRLLARRRRAANSARAGSPRGAARGDLEGR